MIDRPSYNPFEDKTLHTVQESTVAHPDLDRTPFNDVIKHADIVLGYQAPKLLDQFPRWFQLPQRIYAGISVLIFVGVIVYQFMEAVVVLVNGN